MGYRERGRIGFSERAAHGTIVRRKREIACKWKCMDGRELEVEGVDDGDWGLRDYGTDGGFSWATLWGVDQFEQDNPSGAKAPAHFVAYAARLKSRLFT